MSGAFLKPTLLALGTDPPQSSSSSFVDGLYMSSCSGGAAVVVHDVVMASLLRYAKQQPRNIQTYTGRVEGGWKKAVLGG